MNKYDPDARFIDRFRFALRYFGPVRETEYVLLVEGPDGQVREEKGKLGRKATHVRHLLRELADHADWDSGDHCFPGFTRLARHLAVSRQTVGDTARIACGTGWLTRRKPKKEGGGARRTYEFTLHIPPEVEAKLATIQTGNRPEVRKIPPPASNGKDDMGSQVSSQGGAGNPPRHVGFSDTNLSGNKSERTNSSNPSGELTVGFVSQVGGELEVLVTLARKHLSRSIDHDEINRSVIGMWRREGRTVESIRRVIIGLRAAIEGKALAGFIDPGSPASCRVLVKTTWSDRHAWDIAEEFYWKTEGEAA